MHNTKGAGEEKQNPPCLRSSVWDIIYDSLTEKWWRLRWLIVLVTITLLIDNQTNKKQKTKMIPLAIG